MIDLTYSIVSDNVQGQTIDLVQNSITFLIIILRINNRNRKLKICIRSLKYHYQLSRILYDNQLTYWSWIKLNCIMNWDRLETWYFCFLINSMIVRYKYRWLKSAILYSSILNMFALQFLIVLEYATRPSIDDVFW